ncbi:hypothetical protein [Thermococcus sp.]
MESAAIAEASGIIAVPSVKEEECNKGRGLERSLFDFELVGGWL